MAVIGCGMSGAAPAIAGRVPDGPGVALSMASTVAMAAVAVAGIVGAGEGSTGPVGAG